MLASAKQILATLKKAEATAVTVEDASQVTEKFAETVLNGDGSSFRKPPGTTPPNRSSTTSLPASAPSTDRSGKPGISQAKVDQFFADAQAYSDWQKQGGIRPGGAAVG